MLIDNDDVLLCPICRFAYLHHANVEVFERKEGREGVHVSVSHDDGTVKVDTNLSENPSEHRQGIVITFYCEECKNRSFMTIAQHKGMTFVKQII